MRVLIIRHAIAQDRESFAKTRRDDAERPLTKEGRSKMHKGAKGLRRVIDRFDVLASSPFVRAIETARIVSEVYGGKKPVTLDALKPAKTVKAVLQWLEGQPGDATIALVGHEPHLGMLVSYLLSGEQRRSFVALRKGSACLLDFDDAVKAGAACMHWLLKPQQLRDLAEM
jgi:phosphohistidine phosphatase